MVKIECKCGELLSNSMPLNDIQLKVYTDIEWDKMFENDIIETRKLPLPTYDVWKCPKCERVYVFEEGSDKAIKIYSLETV
jgi:phosphoribosylamine-glycine ligase